MNLIGIFMCLIIFILAIGATYFSVKSKIYYDNLSRELRNKKRDEEYNFKNKEINNIYEEFKNYILKGVSNVNTQVIIEDNLPKKQIKIEKLLIYSESLAVVLGLLGTFIGLTFAIGSIENIISVMVSSNSDLTNFLEEMGAPVSSMATAFYTSIAGIVSSVMIKVVGICTYKVSREGFLDKMESYLDNDVTSKYSVDNLRVLANTSKNLERNIKNMCDNITGTFERSFEGFGHKTVALSAQLIKSSQTIENNAGSLATVIKNFEKSVEGLKEPTKDFGESVERFESYYNGVSTLTSSLDKSVNSFALNLQKAAIEIKEGRESTMGINKDVRKMLKSNIEHLEIQRKFTQELYKTLNKTYKKFEMTIGASTVSERATKERIPSFFNRR